MFKAKTPKFKKTIARLEELKNIKFRRLLSEIGEKGVSALSATTPVDSGETSTSWYYRIEEDKGSYKLIWGNDNVLDNGVPLVILLQYGHGTRGGRWVPGRDFINPALEPIFEEFKSKLQTEVRA